MVKTSSVTTERGEPETARLDRSDPPLPDLRKTDFTSDRGSYLESLRTEVPVDALLPRQPKHTETAARPGISVSTGTPESPYSLKDLLNDPSKMVVGAHYLNARGESVPLVGDGRLAPGQELSDEQKLRSLRHLLKASGVSVPEEVLNAPQQETRTFYLRAKISEYSDTQGITASGMDTRALLNGVAMEFDLSHALSKELGVPQTWLRGTRQGAVIKGEIVTAGGETVNFYDTGGLHNPMEVRDWRATFKNPSGFAADGNPIFEVPYRAIDVAHPEIVPGLKQAGELGGLIRIDLPTKGPDGRELPGLSTGRGYSTAEALAKLQEWSKANPSLAAR